MPAQAAAGVTTACGCRRLLEISGGPNGRPSALVGSNLALRPRVSPEDARVRRPPRHLGPRYQKDSDNLEVIRVFLMEAAGVTTACGCRRLLEISGGPNGRPSALVGSNLALRPRVSPEDARVRRPPRHLGPRYQKDSDNLEVIRVFLMEAAGVEPASAIGSREASTCVER